MSIKRRRFFPIWLCSTLLCISSCSVLRMAPRNDGGGYQQTRTKPVKWQQIKEDILAKDLAPYESKRLVLQIDRRGLELTVGESSEVVDMFPRLTNSELKHRILSKLYDLSAKNNKILGLSRRLAASDDHLLSPLALYILISAEIALDKNGNDQWETWQWSKEVQTHLEQAADEKLFKLPRYPRSMPSYDVYDQIIGNLELLRLVDRFPNSKLAQGAVEYRKLSGGLSYFGPYIKSNEDDQPVPVLRIPFNPDYELTVWPVFLKKL